MESMLQEIAGKYATPCFVYDLDQVYRRIDLLRQAFGGRFKLSYAVKANPHPHLLTRLIERADTLDISSGGELERAIALGWPAKRLSFTGPGKRTWELAASIEHGIGEVIVESLDEMDELGALARAAGRKQDVLIRIAPGSLPRGFGVNMSGKPSQFGIDEENAPAAVEHVGKIDGLRLAGFHVYAGTQCLNVDSICENYANLIAIFRRLVDEHSLRIRKLIFGSGIGIPYHQGDEPVDVQAIAAKTNPMLDEMKKVSALADVECLLEMGRFLIGEAGYYLTRVIRVKKSRGVNIGICDGGMNHHLGACGHLGSILHRNYRMFKVSPDCPDAQEQPYELVGPLCTSIDTLGHGVKFNGLAKDDVIAVRSSGAYGLTASPIYFISHKPAKEVFVETVNGQRTITEASQTPARLTTTP